MRTIILSFCLLSLIMSWSIEILADDADNSFTTDIYYSWGIPQKISTLADYEKAYEILLLKSEQKGKNEVCIFPKYDSPKSGYIFKMLFDTSVLDDLLVKATTYSEKQRLLLEFSKITDLFLGPFLGQSSSSCRYHDESTRIGVQLLYSKILMYEIFENHLVKNQLKISDVLKKKDNLQSFKMFLYTDICELRYYGTKVKLDIETKKYVDAFLATSFERIKNIQFMEFGGKPDEICDYIIRSHEENITKLIEDMNLPQKAK